MSSELDNKGVEAWEDFREGSEQAFEQLYRLYNMDMYRYGFRYSEKVELVEDAIHDVFLQIYKLRHKLPTQVNPKAYLLVAMRNTLRNIYNTKEMSIEFLQLDNLNYSEDTNIEDEIVRAEEDLQKKQNLFQLQSILTEKEKQAIHYRVVENLSYSDIAYIMNIKEQSAKNIVHRTLNKIRLLLK